jgi:hypothetical protein
MDSVVEVEDEDQREAEGDRLSSHRRFLPAPIVSII